MPELPEVETTVRDLRKKLVGLRFKDVWTDWPKTFKKAGGFENFKKAIKNKKILSIRRRAKFIVIDIEGKYSIFIHQKISGHLLYGRWAVKPQIPNPKSQTNSKPKIQNSKQIWVSIVPGPLRDERENQYIRTIWTLSNGYQLAFSDLRRFGKIVLVKDDDLSELPEIKKLGPEPLEINFKKFKELFWGRQERAARNERRERGRKGASEAKSPPRVKKGRIKQVLMDPFFVAGIGNIYSDEILWDAGYHPLSRAENLSEADIRKIYNSTRKILKQAIKAGGTSIEDYRKISGEMGEYQDYTEAYHQDGDKCSKRDGGIIKRIKLGGRSAHFCPKHQKLK